MRLILFISIIDEHMWKTSGLDMSLVCIACKLSMEVRVFDLTLRTLCMTWNWWCWDDLLINRSAMYAKMKFGRLEELKIVSVFSSRISGLMSPACLDNHNLHYNAPIGMRPIGDETMVKIPHFSWRNHAQILSTN